MPDHKLHLLVDWMFVGKYYPEVHKYLDQFQPYLHSNHRHFLHDQEGIELVWKQTGDEGAMMSAYLHIVLDEISDIVGQERAVPVLLNIINENMMV